MNLSIIIISAEQVLKACLVLPADSELMKRLQPIIGRLMGLSDKKLNHNSKMWRFYAIALVCYREKHFDESLKWLKKIPTTSEDSSRDAMNLTLRAITQYQLLRSEEARRDLEGARKLIEPRFATKRAAFEGVGSWQNWLIARILLREADVLIVN